MTAETGRIVALAGASGDLGRRIAIALRRHGVTVQALVRQGMPDPKQTRVRETGANPVEVDFDSVADLTRSCDGAECVVSAVNGIDATILGLQARLLDAAVAAGVPRFISSDFAIDFTKTKPGLNRNLDLRRTFMSRADSSPIRATSILNGAFADMLTGQAPLLLHKIRRVLYWGAADQPYNFTTKDDVADFTANAALDHDAPRLLRIAGDTVTPRDLARLMTSLERRPWKLLRAGGVGFLSGVIRVARALTPATEAPFPAWQGMQYMRDMTMGDGRLAPLDNARYGERRWAQVSEVLAATGKA